MASSVGIDVIGGRVAATIIDGSERRTLLLGEGAGKGLFSGPYEAVDINLDDPRMTSMVHDDVLEQCADATAAVLRRIGEGTDVGSVRIAHPAMMNLDETDRFERDLREVGVESSAFVGSLLAIAVAAADSAGIPAMGCRVLIVDVDADLTSVVTGYVSGSAENPVLVGRSVLQTVSSTKGFMDALLAGEIEGALDKELGAGALDALPFPDNMCVGRVLDEVRGSDYSDLGPVEVRLSSLDRTVTLDLAEEGSEWMPVNVVKLANKALDRAYANMSAYDADKYDRYRLASDADVDVILTAGDALYGSFVVDKLREGRPDLTAPRVHFPDRSAAVSLGAALVADGRLRRPRRVPDSLLISGDTLSFRLL